MRLEKTITVLTLMMLCFFALNSFALSHQFEGAKSEATIPVQSLIAEIDSCRNPNVEAILDLDEQSISYEAFCPKDSSKPLKLEE